MVDQEVVRFVFPQFEDEEEDEEDKVKAKDKEISNSHWMQRYERIGLKIISQGAQLKGKHRFAADGFIQKEQCQELITLTDVSENNPSRHNGKVNKRFYEGPLYCDVTVGK